MIPRKYVAPVGRTSVSREFTYSEPKYPKSKERSSIISWKRRSQRPAGEASGGGRIVGH